jgi:predicted SAM-dependent methyltransferase
MRVLNLGCGDSAFGTDRVDKRETLTTTAVFDVEKGLRFPDETFDKIYSRNLLEHLRNPGFFLEECYRVLKSKGTIELITDNAECTRFYWFGTHTGRYEKKHEGDRHFCIFTRSHLKNHFEQAGFKVLSITYVKTDTLGKWLDIFTRQKPRIMVVAEK